MGTVVNNNSTEIILSSVDSPPAVEMHATVLSTVKSDNGNTSGVDQNMETDQSTIIHTAIMVESVETDENLSNKIENKQSNFKTRFSSLIDSDSDSDDNGTCNITYSKPSRVNLFDSESENEENNNEDENFSSVKETEDVKSKSKSTIKMTGKEAQIQRLEIASASQRRLRESRLSLPYHKPKQRTLKEFLKIRPKISDPVPEDLKNMSSVNAIKLASIRTTEISKKLEEREKILEKFYKSSSESETEENEKDDELIEKSVINTSTSKDKNDEKKIDETNENDTPQIEEINENSEMNNKSSENIVEEEPCSIQGILDELQIDYSKFKHELIKSFLQPTKLIERMEADIKSFEDQDFEETELISEFELNKIIDTLNTEDASKTNSNDQIMEIDDDEEVAVSTKCDVNIENMNNNQGKWTENKCFNELSDSEKDETNDAVMEHNNTELKENIHLTNIKTLTPRLTGDKNQIIDLSEDIFEKNKGVKNLVERFVQHNAKKSHSPKVLQVRVVTEDTGGFKEEKLTMQTHHEDEDVVSPINEKPGAKLMRLREDLQKKIAKRRAEEWARKQKETKELLGVVENDDEEEEEDDFESIYKNEKDDCCSDKKTKGDVDNGVDGDDEAEDEDVEDEDEEEEDVDYYKEKKTKKNSEFVDEEAEESGNEEDGDESEEEDGESVDNDEDENEQNQETEKNKVRPRRRIKELTEDSTDTENETAENDSQKLPKSTTYQTQTEESPINKSQNDMFSTQSKTDCDGDEFPLCQPPILKTPLSKRNNCEAENNFLSPVLQFTALQSLSLDTKTIHQQSPNCTFTIPNEPSPLRNEKYSPKQLFCDSKIPNTQENLNELMELCSGKFSDSSQALTAPSQPQLDFTLTPDAEWTTQRIITASQSTDTQKKTTDASQELNGNNLKTENNSFMKLFTSDDESEIELKKIMSSNSTNTPKPTKNELFLAASSSEDENKVLKTTKKQRKLVKKKPVKLFCSDDEDDASENSIDKEINSNDDGSDDQEEDVEETHEIGYDSEENEILVEKPKATRVKDFFDAEAELSEDEHMGSDDESEDGLDEMELEEGDRDKLNESEVKRQLEKIHMKQILDEDKRDVRILQELLLEDGDLHSDKGRQRQFRWKNSMDAGLGNDENVQPFDNESELISIDEEQDGDSEWRKARFEREKILKEQRLKEKLDTSDIDLVIEGGDSILKLGQTKLRTSGVSSMSCKRTSMEKCSSVINVSQDIKKPLGLTNKKGSFLTRGQSTLARLAAVATTKSTDIIGGVKNSRNFVFQTLDPPPTVNGNNNINNKNSDDKKVTKNNINGKRKATDLDTTPLMFKKLRVADSLDKKVSSRVKKLLNNL
ncbi:claspin [Chrysoperla carnea]|uniref:claspin n=1 Tax=Chrysoperla carnea TaxID=189513 RepID=UPI001D091F89|nr:claspin [Chrysoperla carnea]